jgi:ribosomal-protein-alanine N-acetyltransferase
MYRPFLIGQKLYLGALEGSDVCEEYIKWLNDTEVTRYMEIGKYPSTPETIRVFLERFQGSTTDIIFAIVDQKTDQPGGNVTFNRINWIHRTADTGLMIGHREF